jgi:hypothetical protein
VTLEVFLTMEATGASSTDKTLGQVMAFKVWIPGAVTRTSSFEGNFLVGEVVLRID